MTTAYDYDLLANIRVKRNHVISTSFDEDIKIRGIPYHKHD